MSGRTWRDVPVQLILQFGDTLLLDTTLQTDQIGEFLREMYPREVGEYTAIFRVCNPANSLECVEKIKTVTVKNISDHFTEPLMVSIDMQGSFSKNRWLDGQTFHCQSRGSCSVNVAALVNRKKNITYTWTMPDGSTLTEKNPKAVKISYGTYFITLHVVDEIT